MIAGISGDKESLLILGSLLTLNPGLEHPSRSALAESGDKKGLEPRRLETTKTKTNFETEVAWMEFCSFRLEGLSQVGYLEKVFGFCKTKRSVKKVWSNRKVIDWLELGQLSLF